MKTLSRLAGRLSLLCAETALLLLCSAPFSTTFAMVCDSGDLNGTCTISTAKTLSNGEVISGTGSLVIAAGGNLISNAMESFSIAMDGDITIESGGAITGNLSSLQAENLIIESGGGISANAKGLESGQGEGAGNMTADHRAGGGGAGHGGTGGKGSSNAAGGCEYGSLMAPETPGSGGGYNTSYASAGGTGGGVIKLVVDGVFTLDGAITCNGTVGLSMGSGAGGGGSGGSIWIDANTLDGEGSISANGGPGSDAYNGGGGGSGGRIAVYSNIDNSSAIFQALGGYSKIQYGEIGTIYPIPPKAITAFSFDSPPAVGLIDEDAKTVDLDVPYGTSLTGLVPAIAITGVSVSPASGAAQDFMDGVPITYTVTAYDTSTQAYAVTINVEPPSSNNTITSDVYTVSTGGTGYETIVNVPFGISLANFLAALTAGDGTQNWDSSDLTDPIISRQELIVSAQDGSTTTYVVYINLMPGDANHDGLITMEDLILAIQATAGLETAAPVYGNADVNGDGVLGLTDSLYIMRELLK